MTMSDPLGDMLARIRNGQHAQKKVISCPGSKLRSNVLNVLKREGFIRDFKELNNDRGLPELQIELKYAEGQPAIRNMRRVSSPGRRVYSKVKDMPSFYNGLGVTIVSTPRGVMADYEARTQNIGGEVLCQVF